MLFRSDPNHGKRHSTKQKRPPLVDNSSHNEEDQMKKAGKDSLEAFKKCEGILQQLKRHPYSAGFLLPISFPEYNEVINEPMDLSTVENKLKNGAYLSSTAFVKDIRQIWNNAWKFNQPGSEIYIATTNISNYFESLMGELENVEFTPGTNTEIQESRKQVLKRNDTARKIKGSGNQASKHSSKKPVDKPMLLKEKETLVQNIQKLSTERPMALIHILKNIIDFSYVDNSVEFDLAKIPPKKCHELDQAVKKALLEKAKVKVKKTEENPPVKEDKKEVIAMPGSLPGQSLPVEPQGKVNPAEHKEESYSKPLLIL